MSNYENSSFLIELTALMNAYATSGKEITETQDANASKAYLVFADLDGDSSFPSLDVQKGTPYTITAQDFADATINNNNWPLQATVAVNLMYNIDGTDWRISGDEQTPNLKVGHGTAKTNIYWTSLGARQFDAWMYSKVWNGQSIQPYFEDEAFVTFLLQVWSEHKVWNNGVSSKHSYSYEPKMPNTYGGSQDPTTYGANDAFRPPNANGASDDDWKMLERWWLANDANAGTVSSFTNPVYMQPIRPDPKSPFLYHDAGSTSNPITMAAVLDGNQGTGYADQFHRGRMLPLWGGGLTKKGSTEAGEGFNYIPVEFYKKFKDIGVGDWSIRQKRLFLLMAGNYGWSKIAYLNMSATSDNERSRIPREVLQWYEATLILVQNDMVQDSDYYKTLKNVLGGVDPSPELFAQHVTHGVADGILKDLAGDGKGSGIKGYDSMVEDGWDEFGESEWLFNFPFTARAGAGMDCLFWRTFPTLATFDEEEWVLIKRPQYRSGGLYRAIGFNSPTRGNRVGLDEKNSFAGLKGWPRFKSTLAAKQKGYGVGQKFFIPQAKYDKSMTGLPLLMNKQEGQPVFPNRIRNSDWSEEFWFNQAFPQIEQASGNPPLYDDYPLGIEGEARPPFDSSSMFRFNDKDTILDYKDLSSEDRQALANDILYALKKALKESGNEYHSMPADAIGLYEPLERAAEMVRVAYQQLLNSEDGRLKKAYDHIADNKANNRETLDRINNYVLHPRNINKQNALGQDPSGAVLSFQDLTKESEESNNQSTGQTVRTIVAQMYIEAVNVAAAMLYEWMALQFYNHDAYLRWMILWNINMSDGTRDEQALKDELAEAGVTPDDAVPNQFGEGGIEADAIGDDDNDDDDSLTKEEVEQRLKQRRKNVDQCLLLTNIEDLAKEYHRQIGYNMNDAGRDTISPHGPGNDYEVFIVHQIFDEGDPKKGTAAPFGNRIHRLSHTKGEFSKIPNYLSAPKGEQISPFLNITPDIMSALTPKIRLFRIQTDRVGRESEVEFSFSNFISSTEASALTNGSQIQKGMGGGIKSFSFTYEGGTPATATKDINAELVLYFQSFNELTKLRQVGKKKYKYIDLLLYPTRVDSTGRSEQKPLDMLHPNEYNPTNFRIRVDAGWHVRTDAAFRDLLFARVSEEEKKKRIEDKYSGLKQSKAIIEVRKDILNEFNRAIRMINKTFLLNMVDHDLSFRNDGSIEVKINYAAYMDSKLRTSEINALSTPSIEAYKRHLRQEIVEKKIAQECNERQLIALQRQQVTAEESYVKAAQGSINRRMLLRNFQRVAVFNKEEVNKYKKQYSEKAPEIIDAGSVYDLIGEAKSTKQQEVKYYFMGDIIYTLMDCLYLPNPTGEDFAYGEYNPEADNQRKFSRRIPELKNFKICLGSFSYTDYTKEQVYYTANIADIPVSVKFFNDWMTENVIKPERTVYPLMEFVKDLLRAATDLMVDACINKRIDSSLMFQTGQFMGIGKDANPGNRQTSGNRKNKTFLDPLYMGSHFDLTDPWQTLGGELMVDKLYEKKSLPLRIGDEDVDTMVPTKDLFKYMLIYPVAPILSVTHQGRGKRLIDESTGTYHFQIGSNKGLLKNLNFTKTDMAYLREARFYNQGHYGLLQLGAVYNVELELYGNTLFYPGMEIFIDPRGFGGSDWDPTVGGMQRSTANALGIGGYHIVTKVHSTISSDSGFTTKLTALFQYSGDEESRQIAISGKGLKPPKATSVTSSVPSRGSRKCVDMLDKVITDTLIK